MPIHTFFGSRELRVTERMGSVLDDAGVITLGELREVIELTARKSHSDYEDAVEFRDSFVKAAPLAKRKAVRALLETLIVKGDDAGEDPGEREGADKDAYFSAFTPRFITTKGSFPIDIWYDLESVNDELI